MSDHKTSSRLPVGTANPGGDLDRMIVNTIILFSFVQNRLVEGMTAPAIREE
jgi:hypothetical protein